MLYFCCCCRVSAKVVGVGYLLILFLLFFTILFQFWLYQLKKSYYITFIDPHVHEECQGLNKTNMYHRSVLVFHNEMSVKSTKLTTIRYQLFLTVLFSVFIVSFSVTYISTMVVSFTQRHIIFDGSLLHTETHKT